MNFVLSCSLIMLRVTRHIGQYGLSPRTRLKLYFTWSSPRVEAINAGTTICNRLDVSYFIESVLSLRILQP